MNYSLEDIEALRKKANLTYEEAKRYLDDANGDVIEALIRLEKEGKTKKSRQLQSDDIFKYVFTMGYKEKEWFSIPFLLAAILLILSFPVSFPLLLIALFLECYIGFGKEGALHYIRFHYEHPQKNPPSEHTEEPR